MGIQIGYFAKINSISQKHATVMLINTHSCFPPFYYILGAHLWSSLPVDVSVMWLMICIYWNQNVAAAYSSLYSVSFLLNFQTLNLYVRLFLRTIRPTGLNMVHTWIYVCTWYTHIYVVHTYFSSSFLPLLKLSSVKLFVTFFSWAVRPSTLKIGTHVDIGRAYCVYQKQAAVAYLSLYFFILLPSNFQTLQLFVTLSSELWGLQDWNLVQIWTVGGCKFDQYIAFEIWTEDAN